MICTKLYEYAISVITDMLTIKHTTQGKTRPQTGVVFRDPEEAAEITQSNSGRVSYELLAPDQSPVLLSFECPWVSNIMQITLIFHLYS